MFIRLLPPDVCVDWIAVDVEDGFAEDVVLGIVDADVELG